MTQNDQILPAESPRLTTAGRPWAGIGRWVPFFILILAMGLRFTAGWLNREANDNHVDVVNYIINEHRLPQKTDCWSCYQPKLYYVVCAVGAESLNVTEFYHRIRLMNMVNVFFSFFILLIFWKFIDKQGLDEKSKYLIFALLAFNPCLIGINIQSTNDTAAIFFGVLALYSCDLFFRKMKVSTAAVLILALIGGLLSKASMVVITAVVCIAFVIKILAVTQVAEKMKTVKYFLILLIAILAIVPYAGGYYKNYKQYGSLTISAWEKDPAPYFFKKTFITRAGLRSVFEGFCTFRYFGMIRQPYINNEWDNYPMHRTSLWSQMYGQMAFMHFAQWPIGWQTHSPYIIGIGRVLIIIGIIPLAFFLLGLTTCSFNFIKKLMEFDKTFFAAPNQYLYLAVILAFLSSSMFYTYSYRDFSSMKSIYIFPGLLAYLKAFTEGFISLKSQKALFFVKNVFMLMILLSIADITYVIYQYW